MSPGIVRFYFDSKAAMLVASLQYLAAEFEERVLIPVMRLRDRPVAALELMVDLYLDPDLASPRKVSVWYAFWGEASSRQEYYDICGHKDERFAALVRMLIAGLMVETRQPQLDPDAIALGLIGALEIIWQGIAFQDEINIDRAGAKQRCMAYLRSIFPTEFSPRRPPAEASGAPADGDRNLPGWSYADTALLAAERVRLFQGSWQFVGHRAQLKRPGDYLAADIGTERTVVVCGAAGAPQAFRDSCPAAPHRLSAHSSGHWQGALECRTHDLRIELADLTRMELRLVGELVFVRAGASRPEPQSAMPGPLEEIGRFAAELMVGSFAEPGEAIVAADWKVIVEHWCGTGFPDRPRSAGGSIWNSPTLAFGNPVHLLTWTATLMAGSANWSAARYRSLAAQTGAAQTGAPAQLLWRRFFLPPNQVVEFRPDGLSVVQVFPLAPARSRVRRIDYCASTGLLGSAASALHYLAGRLTPSLGLRRLAEAESIQQGLVSFGYEPAVSKPGARAEEAFRLWLRERLQVLRNDPPPLLGDAPPFLQG